LSARREDWRTNVGAASAEVAQPAASLAVGTVKTVKTTSAVGRRRRLVVEVNADLEIKAGDRESETEIAPVDFND
jgi:hypothetical protein